MNLVLYFAVTPTFLTGLTCNMKQYMHVHLMRPVNAHTRYGEH